MLCLIFLKSLYRRRGSAAAFNEQKVAALNVLIHSRELNAHDRQQFFFSTSKGPKKPTEGQQSSVLCAGWWKLNIRPEVKKEPCNENSHESSGGCPHRSIVHRMRCRMKFCNTNVLQCAKSIKNCMNKRNEF